MAERSGTRATSALNLFLAALTGLAIAFAIFAMPVSLLEQAVARSGLPMLLSSAHPPLGLTARLALLVAGGAFGFGLVWLVLRALDRPAKPRPAKADEPAVRLRRADRHPDAPHFRPLRAEADLGAPSPSAFDLPEEDLSQTPEGEAKIVQSKDEVRLFAGADRKADPVAETSIPHLMQRLELGLSRRERDPWSPEPSSRSGAERPREGTGLDERLRSAIDDLQKLTTRSA